MLTTGQVDHFRTFGFVVLRGFLADRAGAPRLVPGSHHPEQSTRLAAYSKRQ